MKNVKIAKKLTGSNIIMGCMRISSLEQPQMESLVHTALEQGINYFDHADIYDGGKCEEMFGKLFKDDAKLRDKMVIQSKCGIRINSKGKGYYDFSKEHILASVEGSLNRLNTDRLDVLLLHRPDTLMEPEEIAQAFDLLHSQGKVLHFGVSNQNTAQVKLLRKYVNQPLVINQLQASLKYTGMFDSGINVNMTNSESVMHDGSILEYSRLKDMTIQAWSPFQYGFFEGIFINNEKFPELNRCLNEIGEKYSVSASAIAVAWLLRHPVSMQVVTGTTNKERLADICTGSEVKITREEWYELYSVAGNFIP